MVSDGTKKNLSKLFKTAYILILISVVLIGCYSATTAYLDYNSQKTTVNGLVVSSDVDRDSTRRGVSYDANIQYNYSYKGTEFSSDNLKPGSGTVSMSKSKAQTLVSDYPEGEEVTVYVDEKNPNRSWLIDKLPISTIITSLIISLGASFILYKKHLKNIAQKYEENQNTK